MIVWIDLYVLRVVRQFWAKRGRRSKVNVTTRPVMVNNAGGSRQVLSCFSWL